MQDVLLSIEGIEGKFAERHSVHLQYIEKIIMHTSGHSHVVLCVVDGMDRNER